VIYFDNSATSYPKPLGVYIKSVEGNLRYSFNSGRGGYEGSIKSGEKIFEVRQKSADLFGAKSENVIFTKNCTEALNVAIKGSVKKGDHILISSLEHNSVARVAEYLSACGEVDYDVFNFNYDCDKVIADINKKAKPNTRLVVCTHASNVFGVTMPINKIGEYCKSKGITFIVDAAQTAGVIDIDVVRDNIDILCTAGHKGLMGNMGTGLMVLNNTKLKPLLQGGTGSSSLSLKHPSELPESFEAGTLNNTGILSLGAGIDFINSCSVCNIYNHELTLAEFLYNELKKNENVQLYTPKPQKDKTVGIISFNYSDWSSEKTASLLAEYGVCTRAGYHCSPLAHRHFGTVDRGTVRLSLGAFNKIEQCEKFIDIMQKI